MPERWNLISWKMLHFTPANPTAKKTLMGGCLFFNMPKSAIHSYAKGNSCNFKGI
jgi:hypothetical protein